MTPESAFFIRNKKQIIKHLELLLKQRCLFNLHFGDNESFITTLLEIDPSADRLLMDYGPKDYLNKRLLSVANIHFRTDYSGIKIAFEGRDIETVRHNGHDAFSVALPKDLLWRQRRQFYRIKSPLSKASYLQLTFDDDTVKLPLYDISISGFAVLDEGTAPVDLLTVHQTLDDCRLILENTAEDAVAFIVTNTVKLNPNKQGKTRKIGCRFTRISSAFESGIQRYMQLIEREHKQKS